MRQKYLLKNEHGYTFVIALLVIILISVLGLGLMTVTSNTLNTTKHERNDQSTFYIAEAGLNVEKKEVYTTIYNAYDWTREEHRQTKEEDRGNKDFVDMFITKIEADLPSQPAPYNNFKLQFDKQPEACIKVNMVSKSPLKISIESTGYLLDSTNTATDTCPDKIVKPNRKVEQVIEVDLNLKFLTNDGGGSGGGGVAGLPNLAVQMSGNIDLENSAKIVGSVVTNNGKVHLSGGGGERITGNIGSNYPLTASYATLEKAHIDKVVNVKADEIPLPPFPTDKFATLSTLPEPAPLNMRKKQIISNGNFELVDGPKDGIQNNVYTLNFTQDTRFKSFVIGSNNILEMNIGSNNVNLLVDTFTLPQGNINIVDSGTLNIYVKNSMAITNGSRINSTGSANQMNIYYAGNDPVNLAGNVKINGSLYAQSANLHFSGSLGIIGNIITGGSEVKIDGAANSQAQYLLAPKADISISSGNFTGILIGKSLKGTGSGKIYYGDNFVVPPPFPPPSTPDYSNNEDLIKDEDLIEKENSM